GQNAAIAHGLTPSNFKHRIYHIPWNTTCSWGGWARLGSTGQDIVINNPVGALPEHELGHNLGIDHSSGLECGNVSYAASPPCQVVTGADFFEVMGGQYPFHFNAHHKELLGWMTATPVMSSGRYTINPIEVATSAVKGLRIKGAAGDVFYVE